MGIDTNNLSHNQTGEAFQLIFSGGLAGYFLVKKSAG